MPRRTPGRNRSRGRGSRNTRSKRSTTTNNAVISLCGEDDFESGQERQPRGRSRSRGRGSRNPRSRRSAANNTVASLCGDDDIESGQERPSQERHPRRARPTVISLDVTYSSDELEDALSSPEKETEKHPRFSWTPSPEPRDAAVESDLSDMSEEDVNKSSIEEEKDKECQVKEVENTEDIKAVIPSDSDSEEDLFNIDYNAKRDKALKAACKELKKLEKVSVEKETECDDSMCRATTPDISVLEEVFPERKSPDIDLSFVGSPTKCPKRKRVKKSKKTIKAQKELKKFSEEMSRLQSNGSLDDDVILMSDDSYEEEEKDNENITLFIKWEGSYLRWPVRRFQKFFSVHKGLADRFGLDIAQVLLWFNDKTISHDMCPKDLNLQFGDMIDGGVQSQPSLPSKESLSRRNADDIPLKVQNEDRKGAVTIYIGRQSTMKELMYRYAEEKNLKLESLVFKFDGEVLDPKETPETLDLEGNECIDVFRKSNCFSEK